MKRIYHTKNAMFYVRTKVTDELKILIEQHRAKYGQDPKRIYAYESDWVRYEGELNPQLREGYTEYGFPRIKLSSHPAFEGEEGIIALHFQGIPVVRIEDWRKLSTKRSGANRGVTK